MARNVGIWCAVGALALASSCAEDDVIEYLRPPPSIGNDSAGAVEPDVDEDGSEAEAPNGGTGVEDSGPLEGDEAGEATEPTEPTGSKKAAPEEPTEEQPTEEEPTEEEPTEEEPTEKVAECDATPGEWSAPAWEANTVAALALRAQLDTLVGDNGMRANEQQALPTSAEALNEVWTAGDPSLASVASPAWEAMVQTAFVDFSAAIAQGPVPFVGSDFSWTGVGDGGISAVTSSSRALSAGGLEVRQIVDKGSFSGGVMYSYAASLTAGEITEATVDAIAAAWGTDPTLSAGLVTDAANYSNQMGFFGAISEGLTAAKAYAGSDLCAAERDQALVQVFRNWEQSMYARFVFYASELENNIDVAQGEDDFVNGLHLVSEGIGLALSFYGLENPPAGPLSESVRLAADADIETMMEAIGVNIQEPRASTLGELSVGFEIFDGVVALEAEIGRVFELTPETVAGYRAAL